MADVESKGIPHELPSSHWLKATGQCVIERYLSATMPIWFRVQGIGSNRKAMNRNWRNQKANLALKTKTGNK